MGQAFSVGLAPANAKSVILLWYKFLILPYDVNMSESDFPGACFFHVRPIPVTVAS